MIEQERRVWIASVVERYEASLIRYAFRITGDLGRARDVVQETFLRLCRAGNEAPGDHLAEWLFTLCRNLAVDHLRKERRIRPMNDRMAQEIAAPPSDAVGKQEEEDRMVKELEQLPKPQQEVLRLKFQEGLSYREIGRITGHSVTNVGFLIHTGLKRLRERLAGSNLPAST